jgi:hypothetical protein
MSAEWLLGYDARAEASGLTGLWPVGRRELFLLRADVAMPLSVDTLVWPSVFDTGQGIGLPRPERERLHLAGMSKPAYTGVNAGLWEDLAALRRYLGEHSREVGPHRIIAVSRWSGSGAGLAAVGLDLARTSPQRPDSQWRRLGYDVADGSLLSGLSNCGYRPEEAAPLRAQWAARLNDAHLFDDPNEAGRFCAVADARVPEHAPFFVYGLHLVEERTG